MGGAAAYGRAVRSRWIALWSVVILIGAAFIKPISKEFELVAFIASFEVVHVVAHLFLYGSLASLALWAGMRPARAAALTLFVAAMQEGVQLLGAARWPGRGEAFDIVVDAIAVALALFVHSRRRARRASHA